jgi:phosphatidylglycerol:prolipoprotein diacylglycerol transferase
MLASITYKPIPIFELGPLNLSLHGLFAGLGFLAGAIVLLRVARRRGFDEGKISSALTWALIGAILGARLFTIPAHLGDPGYGIDDALGLAGTFSIMGGFAGGILAGLWRCRVENMAIPAHLDMASFGLAVGTIVGRIGDLLIVEHLGGRTDFFLGFLVKPGYDLAPQHDGLEILCETQAQCGPYHHAALYDMLGAAVLLGMLWLVARHWSRIRYGTLFGLWVAWYGLQRFVIDFTRNTGLPGADATAGPLTWSQWSGLTLGLAALAVVVWIQMREATPLVSHPQDVAYGAEPVPAES